MSGTVVSIDAIDSLAHRCIATMIVRIYGSLATQRISGGQLLVLERVVAGEQFAWGLMLHARMVAQLDHCRSTDGGEFAFRSILVACFLERVSDAVPEGSAGDVGGMRATIEVVVDSFGSPRWWRRWPLLLGRGDTDMAADAASDTSVPLCWGGLPG
jgi:hypothetical protein